MSAVLAATRAELTKIYTLPSVWLTTGAILALQILVSIPAMGLAADAVANITPDGTIEIFIGQPQPATRALTEYLVASSFQMSVFLPVLAAIIAGQEFRSRQLGLTVLAVPRRGRLLVAKTLAAAAYLAVVAILIVAISTAVLYDAVRDWNPGLLLTDAVFLGHAKFVAFAVLFPLIGFAATIVGRGVLAGILVSVALIGVTMTQVLAATAPAVDALLPVSAGRNLLLDPELSDLQAGPAHALTVLIGWTLAAVVAAGITLHRRDAR